MPVIAVGLTEKKFSGGSHTYAPNTAEMTLSLKKWPVLFFARKHAMILLRPSFRSNTRSHAKFELSSTIFQYFLTRQRSILKISFEKFKAFQNLQLHHIVGLRHRS